MVKAEGMVAADDTSSVYDGCSLDMTVSDLKIFRSANLFLELHGEEAVAKARDMVRDMQELAISGSGSFCHAPSDVIWVIKETCPNVVDDAIGGSGLSGCVSRECDFVLVANQPGEIDHMVRGRCYLHGSHAGVDASPNERCGDILRRRPIGGRIRLLLSPSQRSRDDQGQTNC